MQRYSFASLARNATNYHRDWPRAWRSPEIQQAYDVIIIGGGGHGLSTAYHLAKDHQISNIAVLERGWLGGGNTARNTTVIRSNYLRDESVRFFEASLQLYEQLSRELNFNIMFSQRGQIDLIQTWGKLRDLRRRAYTMRLHGADFSIITPEEIQQRVPIMADLRNARLPIIAGALQERAGIARHDAVAWGYARQADAAGAHILQKTEVTAIRRGHNGCVTGVETNRGPIQARKIAVAVAGNTNNVARMVDLRLPIETVTLQAFVSEPLKPILHTCINCPELGVYVNHSDKGELVIGGGSDPYPSQRQYGSYRTFEQVVAAMLELFPLFRRIKLLRQWAGVLDICHDASPIVSRTPVPGLYVSTGWSGGFKAIPIGGKLFAHTIAHDAPHELNAPFRLDRFASGHPVWETAVVSNRH